MPRTILTSGVFDILTPNHLRLLAWCARLGELVVAIDSAATVPALGKGPDRPLLSDSERTSALNALPCVSRTFVFNGPGAAEAIRIAQPDIWVKGGDYTYEKLRDDETQAIRDIGAGICFAPIFDGPSTTEIIERIQKGSLA
jgi:rfaE bifunctional protein nucleotidyltransferase chain/domain